MKRNSATQFFALLILLGASGTACAHSGHGASGLVTGLLHPFSGMDHFLAMLAVGMWAGQNGGRKVWLLPALFMAMLATGAVVALNYPLLPLIEPGIAASVLVLGFVVARSLRLPVLPSVALTALFGLLHGYAHGVEIPGAIEPAAYALGFLVSTAALHLIGITLGVAARGHLAYFAQIVGGVIAASGMWMLSTI